ncbi:MAG: putative metal-binding motif-containing protein, partial [Myxococcales bacterium]|nr:putative metal-binding motif-containing protein [Myxococcales bacterium]
MFPDFAADYAYTRARTLETLASAADLEVRGLPVEVDGGAPLAFEVRVTNRTGHKLPTGYPEGRRMWIEVTAQVDDQPPFFVSGHYDPVEAELDEDAQVRLYAMHAGVADEGPTFHLVLNDAIFLDTRIPPRGFDPAGAVDLLPVGRDYGDGAGGWRHWDDAPFAAPAPGAAQGVVTITARLLYQTMTRDYIEWLRDTNHSNQAGQAVYDLWVAAGRAPPVEMARVVARARIAGTPCAPDEVCNGVDDDCDGTVDEGFGVVSCGTGACYAEAPACQGGEAPVCTPGAPGDEICDGEDDDCDGAVDE